MSLYIDIRENDFDVGQEQQLLAEACPHSGGQVLFVGRVRGSGNSGAIPGPDCAVEALDLSHYPGMTETTIGDICQRAQKRWGLNGIRVIHRVGRLKAGEQIVLVAVASLHRAEAFEGAEFIMDELKTRATFWKKEIRSDGEHWLDMKQQDRDRSARWLPSAPED